MPMSFMRPTRLSQTLTRATSDAPAPEGSASSASWDHTGLAVMDLGSVTKRASLTSTTATRRETRKVDVWKRATDGAGRVSSGAGAGRGRPGGSIRGRGGARGTSRG